VCYAGRGADGLVNKAAGASARAISELETWEARHAVDNDVKTASCTEVEQSPWWAVDLGQNFRINIVTVTVPSASGSLRTPNY